MIKTSTIFMLLFAVMLTLNINEHALAQADTVQTTVEAIIESTAPEHHNQLADEGQATSNLLEMQRSEGFSLMTILRGLLGMFSLIVIAFIFSSNRKAINWKVIFTGLAIQLALAIGVLYVPWIQYFFEAVGKLFVLVLDFTKAGTEFLFSSFASNSIES
ncbi:MAG TPA: Na+ dependent nucleoside transporter N-terminal domain-containing protein, partial [Bacteroidales bacterium]|nr:Na+ dependent nucleoside transporter N-terminal domain-containing protein [Bacteroidales bacterium]